MKKTIIAAVCMALAALVIMLVGFNWKENSVEADRKPVLLMVESDTGAYMLQLRLGVQQAVEELGCELTVEVLRPDGTLSSRRDWAEYEFGGAVVCMEDASLRESALSMLDAREIPSVVVGSWDGVHNAVCQDEAQLGSQAAELAADFRSVFLAGGSDAARKAAEAKLGDRLISEAAFDPFSEQTAVIALDEKSAPELCRRKEEEGWRCALIAADPGENRADLLERKTVQALLLPSPYAVGYRAAIGVLRERAPKLAQTPYFVVDRESMYEAQNVKLVFPLLN